MFSHFEPSLLKFMRGLQANNAREWLNAVSYTHLTLPTNRNAQSPSLTA